MRAIDADTLFAEIKERHDMFAECEYIGDKARRDELSAVMADIVNAPTVATDTNVLGKWISVKDRLPEMHNSIFAPWHGSEKWTNAMWREESDRMIVAVLFPDGSRGVGTARLHDGKWQTDIISRTLKPTVTHWMPLPEPPKEDAP